MEIETIAAVGLVFAAASLGRFVYEREMDVLYGPYIERRRRRPVTDAIGRRLLPVVDRLRWNMRNAAYLASIAA